jgi:hypothetical protein
MVWISIVWVSGRDGDLSDFVRKMREISSVPESLPLWCWLTDCFPNNNTVLEQQESRAKVSALLERSGARL